MAVKLQTIEKITDRSKNLRGDFAEGLRVSVRRAKVIMKEATQRTLVDVNMERLERENAELRAKLADLSTKVEKLTDAIRQQNRIAQPNRRSSFSASQAGTAAPAASGPVKGPTYRASSRLFPPIPSHRCSPGLLRSRCQRHRLPRGRLWWEKRSLHRRQIQARKPVRRLAQKLAPRPAKRLVPRLP